MIQPKDEVVLSAISLSFVTHNTVGTGTSETAFLNPSHYLRTIRNVDQLKGNPESYLRIYPQHCLI